MRLVVLLTPTGPVIHRAVAKIATGSNPADNFWRNGNLPEHGQHRNQDN